MSLTLYPSHPRNGGDCCSVSVAERTFNNQKLRCQHAVVLHSAEPVCDVFALPQRIGYGSGNQLKFNTNPVRTSVRNNVHAVYIEAIFPDLLTMTQAGKSATELINVIRARAGKWRWDNNGNVSKVEDHSADMTAATPATIDIHYILAERSREYFGEGYRWYDLIRTQKWADLSSTYEICGATKGDHTPVTVTRDIKPYHYLRPIPQGQLDGFTFSYHILISWIVLLTGFSLLIAGVVNIMKHESEELAQRLL